MKKSNFGHIVFKSSGNGLTIDCKVGSYEAGENSNNSSSNSNFSNNSRGLSSNLSYANTSNSSNVDVQ